MIYKDMFDMVICQQQLTLESSLSLSSVEYKDFWAVGCVFRQQEITAGSFICISGTISDSFKNLPEILENRNKVPELPEILD